MIKKNGTFRLVVNVVLLFGFYEIEASKKQSISKELGSVEEEFSVPYLMKMKDDELNNHLLMCEELYVRRFEGSRCGPGHIEEIFVTLINEKWARISGKRKFNN